MPSLAHYMTQYDHEHESGWNKFLHGIGIPMIFAGDELIAVGDLFANDTAREWLDESKARIVCGAPVNSHDRH